MADARPYEIRPVRRADAATYLDLCRQLDRESAFTMLEPGERQTILVEQ